MVEKQKAENKRERAGVVERQLFRVGMLPGWGKIRERRRERGEVGVVKGQGGGT